MSSRCEKVLIYLTNPKRGVDIICDDDRTQADGRINTLRQAAPAGAGLTLRDVFQAARKPAKSNDLSVLTQRVNAHTVVRLITVTVEREQSSPRQGYTGRSPLLT